LARDPAHTPVAGQPTQRPAPPSTLPRLRGCWRPSRSAGCRLAAQCCMLPAGMRVRTGGECRPVSSRVPSCGSSSRPKCCASASLMRYSSTVESLPPLKLNAILSSLHQGSRAGSHRRHAAQPVTRGPEVHARNAGRLPGPGHRPQGQESTSPISDTDQQLPPRPSAPPRSRVQGEGAPQHRQRLLGLGRDRSVRQPVQVQPRHLARLCCPLLQHLLHPCSVRAGFQWGRGQCSTTGLDGGLERGKRALMAVFVGIHRK
jgi:hypothetical protein